VRGRTEERLYENVHTDRARKLSVAKGAACDQVISSAERLWEFALPTPSGHTDCAYTSPVTKHGSNVDHFSLAWEDEL